MLKTFLGTIDEWYFSRCELLCGRIAAFKNALEVDHEWIWLLALLRPSEQKNILRVESAKSSQ